MRSQPQLNGVLIKLASRCNYDCTYCYWFRDQSVYKLPPLMPKHVEQAFLDKLRRHISNTRIEQFFCSFHGGEPTLFGTKRMSGFLAEITKLGSELGCQMKFAFTTNAALIDEDWVKLLREFDVAVAVSIDGPPQIHDRRRVTRAGAPTWRQTVAGYLELCRGGLQPTIIGVCDPTARPDEILDHYFDDLGATFCDVLPPEFDHDAAVVPIHQFYCGLFDHWYNRYSASGTQVRILTGFIRGLLGLPARTESIGFGATSIVCLTPRGDLEPHDTLRISGNERVRSSCNVLENELTDVFTDETWVGVREASLDLCATCRACRYAYACGGGHIAQRWSSANKYNNVSVYCSDYQVILDHIASRIGVEMATGYSSVIIEITAALRAGRPTAALELASMHSSSLDAREVPTTGLA